MKRLLLSLSLLLLVSSLLLAEDELGMDERERAWAEARLALIASDFGLEEAPEITGYSADYEASALSFSFNGREYTVFYEEGSHSSLNEAISNALLYAYEKGEGPTVDYIYDGSYSSLSLPDARRGATYAMKDSSGHVLSLLEVSSVDGEAVVLEPVYVGRAYANLPLERTSAIDLQLVISSSVYPSIRPSLRLDVQKRDILYPVNPFASLFIIAPYSGYSPSAFGYFGLFGFSYTLRLGSFFRNMSFTLVQDASIVAKAGVLAGYFGGFSYGALWSVAYEHSIGSRFYWSLGLSPFAVIGATELSQYPVSLSFGVRL